MAKRKSTMVELVQELEKIEHRTPLIEQIIKEAKAGEFHDYKNEKYVCGKVAANELLTRAGLHELAAQIRRGEYDEEADEEDQKMLSNIIRDMVAGR